MAIDANTPAEELAAIVSQVLEAAGIKATLSGGGAVSIYSDNKYKSKDLDFVTSERRDQLSSALAPLGVHLASDRRHFTHPDTDLFLEFPGAPLEFGSRMVQHDEIPKLDTLWGPLRVITPTLYVMIDWQPFGTGMIVSPGIRPSWWPAIDRWIMRN
ncbi:hypothetical protein [Microbulbifer sp. ARAS458-1]|uniref:hypothetical protein n=1 Tax=Microbulbifer sp. ARAS458-1 TaxID=3140242 RepID=UPI003877CB9E